MTRSAGGSRGIPCQDAGRATVTPGVSYAGKLGTWTLAYCVGKAGLKVGGRINIHTDSDTDWELPQTRAPESTGYTKVLLPGREPDETPLTAVFTVASVKKMHLTLLSGTLKRGEKISVVFGANHGLRMQTFAEERRYFHIDHVDESGLVTRLSESPSIAVIGSEPHQLTVLNPSDADSGTIISVLVKAEDRWGNAASGFEEDITLALGGQSVTVRLPHDKAVARLQIPVPVVDRAQFFRPEARSSSFRARGNPILVSLSPGAGNAGSAKQGTRQFWGDFHGGQLADPEKIKDYYEYAMDVSDLSFCSYQRNDHEMTDSDWEIQKRTDLSFHRPGHFIALPGYEWSADTHLGGDRIVLFPRHGLPLLRSSYSAVEGDQPDPSRELFDQKALYDHYRFTNVVLLPHVGGRQSDIEFHDPALEHVVEIASTHGTFEWFYLDALRRGYKVGVVAGSDGYTGRPGAEFPGYISRRFSRSGAAAVRAKDLTLHSILDAMRARRTYATSGPRIYLDLQAAGVGLGEEVRVSRPVELRVTVHGTTEIDRVEVFCRDRLVHTHLPQGGIYKGRWRVVMNGAAGKRCYSGVKWVGRLTLSDARVDDLRPLRFDSPRSTMDIAEEAQIKWDTTNCGYAHGFEFVPCAMAGAPSADAVRFELAVESHLYNKMYAGAEIPGTMRVSRASGESACFSGTFYGVDKAANAEPRSGVPLGPGDRSILVEPVYEGRPELISFTYMDPQIAFGINPYWIRVTQRDMHNAWSSPIFVNFDP